jgi:uncharacterized membrane protein
MTSCKFAFNRIQPHSPVCISLMPLAIFTAITAIVFCIGDTFMIPLVMRPLFQSALGNQMLETLRLGPATVFYLIHIGGLVWFAGRPAAAGGAPANAFLNGTILGFVAYSCYEMTSWTIMRDWHGTLVLVDLAWGTALSGTAAWSGAFASSKFTAIAYKAVPKI